jgi:selenocysteine-specific elongation factor
MPPERHVVFGTAGHVDHGKSALVLALTGTDPDRLAEEKAREMTIDLGFAFLSLPGIDGMAAIVDVPGHERFLRNMVAGATGVDAALFVIAADDGVMPQTREHLDVMRHLRVSAGVIALTKMDRVSDARCARAAEEAADLTRGTFLEGAPIIPVSAVTGQGLAELRRALAQIGANVTPRPSDGAFRLPIDRVFTLKGIGAIATGTVVSGTLRVGDAVACLPQELMLRARSLQVHHEAVERVSAGQRAAINLPDVAKEDLHRGDVLITPGSLAPSSMVDASVQLSATAPKPLEQRTRVRVHHGTREVTARVVLLEDEGLAPGESAAAQLRLESQLVPAAGDPFVLRSYSPMVVVGGGTVVDPHPPKRRKTRGIAGVAEREALTPSERVLEMLERAGRRGIEFGRLVLQSSYSEQRLQSILGEMGSAGHAHSGRRQLWFSATALSEMESEIVARLVRLHAKHPLLVTVPLNELAAGVVPSPQHQACFRLALDALHQQEQVAVTGDRLRLATHAPRWAGGEALARDKILEKCRDSGLAAPSAKELAAVAAMTERDCQHLLDALVVAGELRLLGRGSYLHPDVADSCRARVLRHLEQNGTMTIGQCRVLLGASRKFLLPFLEQLDREGLTVRQGDRRVLAVRR